MLAKLGMFTKMGVGTHKRAAVLNPVCVCVCESINRAVLLDSAATCK